MKRGEKMSAEQQTSRKILVVDDDQDFRWTMGNVLQAAGYRVIQAQDGEEAMSLLEKDTPDLILLDYRMPGETGLKVAAKIIKKGSGIPIIMITAYAEVKSAVEAIKMGVYDYVVKSGNYWALLPSVIFKAIKQHEMEREKARLALDLERLVITDDLTGLFNRRYFYRKIEEEMVRAKRQNGKLTLILFDLDHFKEYNDTFGHLEGDRALKEVGKIILSSIRDKVDSGCRYGGDEFAIILPSADIKHASDVAGRIQRSVREKKMGNIDISTGIAEYDSESSMEDFIKAADDALYEAKKQEKRGD